MVPPLQVPWRSGCAVLSRCARAGIDARRAKARIQIVVRTQKRVNLSLSQVKSPGHRGTNRTRGLQRLRFVIKNSESAPNSSWPGQQVKKRDEQSAANDRPHDRK